MMRRTAGVAFVLLAGCGAPEFNNPHQHVTGFRYNVDSYYYDAKRNYEEAVAWYRAHEWRFNKGRTDAPPALCLALSGGGSRAAAFELGVLERLEELKTLQRVDVISGASGGAYLMSWFYAQHLNAHGHPDLHAMFDPKDRYQDCLTRNSALVPKSALAGSTALDVLMLPVNLLLNGVFGWHANTTPTRRFYEQRIKEVWDREPIDGCGRFKTLRAFLWPVLGMARIEWAAVRDMLVASLQEPDPARRPPFLVVNATVAMDHGIDDFEDKMANAIFEFTPLSYGSDAFGRGETFPFGFDRAIAVSGAALDSAIIAGSSQKTLFSALNVDLGYYAPNTLNPEVDTAQVVVHRLLPFPFYFPHRYLKDKNGIAIYLTDGGHSDNLAAFSLVRRLCDRIIIIDGEHEDAYPQWRFEGYHRLQRALRSEMDVQLGIDAIDHDAFDPRAPIMQGSIKCFPALRDNGPNPPPPCASDPNCDALRACAGPALRQIEVDYVKLSLDPLRLPQYEQTVRDYYVSNQKECNPPGPLNSCTFPQQPTTDQWFSPAQFKAYRDLGYGMARLYGDRLLAPEANAPVEEAVSRPQAPSARRPPRAATSRRSARRSGRATR